MDYRTLKVSLDSSGILEVVLNRPDVRNAFNEEVIDDLTQVFGGVAGQPEVRAVILRGEGAVFCAGGDLYWMKKAVDFTYEENLKDTRKLSQMFALINECTKPVIGAVHGAAIGGGVGLVSVCDIAIGTAETQFSLSEVRLGIVPACIGPFVLAKIGASHARRLFVSAERFSSSKAKEIGLLHEVVPDSVALREAVQRTVSQILQCGPNALAIAKRLILDLSWPERRAQYPDCLEYVAKTLADVRISQEGKEGVRAFLEKTKPTWLK
jgi:methylglutaconyl-CoA hydratase